MNKNAILQCDHINKFFQEGNQSIHILKDIHFNLEQGERIAIVGASGSGKSTLLHILGGLEIPNSGKVSILGRHFSDLNTTEQNKIRNQNIGFVYQFHHLLLEFSVLENVSMPLLIRGISQKNAFPQATNLLKRLGLFEKRHSKPSEISGGEKQRTAIARALVINPSCILADEPTGNLDSETAMQVFSIFQEFKQTSLVLVTHDMSLANKMDRILELKNGILLPFADEK